MRRAEKKLRLDLPEIIEELLEQYRNPDDWPAEHRCTKSDAAAPVIDWPVTTNRGYDPALGYDDHLLLSRDACQHAEPRSLTARLADLVEPGRGGAKENPGKAPSGPKYFDARRDNSTGHSLPGRNRTSRRAPYCK